MILARRRLLALIGSTVVLPAWTQAREPSLATAPIELGGDWGRSLPSAALRVLERMRAVSLADIRLLSDRQPRAIRVDNSSDGYPAIWLHYDDAPVAWIKVNIGERDWSKLAYQFGHELGHVLANSWARDARPTAGSQWLEEALVEAFSLRGLGLLAASWQQHPPFAGDSAFGAEIRRYRDNQFQSYAAYALDEGIAASPAAWFRRRRAMLESQGGLGEPCTAAIPLLLAELTADPDSVADVGALNRWAERSALPLESYLAAWTRSCRQIGHGGSMPSVLRARFGI